MARRLLLLTSAALALALPSAPAFAATTCAGADAAISAQTLGDAREAVLCIVNAERSARGLNALTQDAELKLAAERHSQDMLLRGFFDHVNPDGQNPGVRITAAGYAWSSYGENIAAGYTTPRKVMAGWMQSKGHCQNVLNPGFTQLGVGVTAQAATLSGGLGTWTQNFGRPQGTPAPGSDDGPSKGCPYATLEGLDSAPAPPGGSGSDTDGDDEHGSGSKGDDDKAGISTGQTPAEDAIPFSTAPGLSLDLRRSGRRLILTGAAPAAAVSRVRVTIVRRGRVVLRGVARVRDGRYRVRLKGVPRTGRIVVRVRGGGERVTRTIG